MAVKLCGSISTLASNACGLALVASLMHSLRKANYLARDVIFLAYENDGMAITNFLRDYHGTNFFIYPEDGAAIGQWKGVIQSGVSIELSGDDCRGGFDNFELRFESNNGLMPNLDLVNSFALIASHNRIKLKHGNSLLYLLRRIVPRGSYYRQLVGVVDSTLAFSNMEDNSEFLKYRIDMVMIRGGEILRDHSDHDAFEQSVQRTGELYKYGHVAHLHLEPLILR